MSHEHPGASSARPTISVVIPTHNRPTLFREALASVLSQTVPSAEVIAVDDASSPPAELPTCHDGVTIHLLRHEQTRGGAAAKNTGPQAARGDLIAFLDDDDLWRIGSINRLFGDRPALLTGIGTCGQRSLRLGNRL